jgi:hypothetical protein
MYEMQTRSSREKMEATNKMFDGIGSSWQLQQFGERHQALQGEHRRIERQPGQAEHRVRQYAGGHAGPRLIIKERTTTTLEIRP